MRILTVVKQSKMLMVDLTQDLASVKLVGLTYGCKVIGRI